MEEKMKNKITLKSLHKDIKQRIDSLSNYSIKPYYELITKKILDATSDADMFRIMCN